MYPTQEPNPNVLDAIPTAPNYPRTSRYYDVGVAVHTAADGTEIRYTRRRLLPRLGANTGDAGEPTTHTVSKGERPDLLGQRYLGNPEQWWRIADANPALDPRELTDEPGRKISVADPAGYPGGMHA